MPEVVEDGGRTGGAKECRKRREGRGKGVEVAEEMSGVCKNSV